MVAILEGLNRDAPCPEGGNGRRNVRAVRPGAVRHIFRGEITLKEFDLDREVDQGRVLACSYGGDGTMLVRVLVDERPDERVERHAEDDIDGALPPLVHRGRVARRGVT